MYTNESHAQEHIMTGHVIAMLTTGSAFFLCFIHRLSSVGSFSPYSQLIHFPAVFVFSYTVSRPIQAIAHSQGSLLMPSVSILYFSDVIYLYFLSFQCHLSLSFPSVAIVPVVLGFFPTTFFLSFPRFLTASVHQFNCRCLLNVFSAVLYVLFLFTLPCVWLSY